MALWAVLLALTACASSARHVAREPVRPQGWQRSERTGSRTQSANGARRLLAGPANWTDPGDTYVPEGGPGSWESGGSTGIIMVHANLMKGGDIVAWAGRLQGYQEYSSAIYSPASKSATQLLGKCGIHDCHNAFCAGHVITPDERILIFGGHADKVQWFRSYNHTEQSVYSEEMTSGRWYPGQATLPDGRILTVGGILDSGQAGYHAKNHDKDNPTYEVFDPSTGSFGGDKQDMYDQLYEAFPIHTYPHVHLTPDGGVAVSAGKTLVKYLRTDTDTFSKDFSYDNRPGPPWSYPQTGVGSLLPLFPPYDKLYFLAAGGTKDDYARIGTPASNKAQVIDLTGGEDASWEDVGPMPYPRVMGDAVILCDGTIGLFGGAEKGIGGWNKENTNVEFKDGTSWWCGEEKCSKAEDPLYEPTLFDPATGQWSEKGSLAESMRPRLYHSISILLPDCKVLVAGSDVTWDQTAEIWSPPYLSLGPQPVITQAPADVAPGDDLAVTYTSEDPVTRAILIRNGAVTHSMAFDARALWLTIDSNTNGTLTVQTPANGNVMPPGLYMLVILTDQGVPSASRILSVYPAGASPPTPTPAPAPAPAA